jgi:plastocyanin
MFLEIHLINKVMKILMSIVVFPLLLLASCKSDTTYDTPTTGNSGTPGKNEVWIQGMAFNPATITVDAGTTIKWINKDNVAHTVTSDNNLFDSGNLNTNGTFSQSFPAVGTFAYHCRLHPYMTATVVVK